LPLFFFRQFRLAGLAVPVIEAGTYRFVIANKLMPDFRLVAGGDARHPIDWLDRTWADRSGQLSWHFSPALNCMSKKITLLGAGERNQRN
jgi:hypothetical protein